jgi:hypothetical protein
VVQVAGSYVARRCATNGATSVPGKYRDSAASRRRSATRIRTSARWSCSASTSASGWRKEFLGTASTPWECTAMPLGSRDHSAADSAPSATWRKPLSSRASSIRERTRS